MPTEAPAKQRRQTWRDWAPDAPEPETLLTRGELLAELQRRGLKVPERTLIHWQNAGAVPAPVRRRFRGATRATYPGWVVPLVAQVRDLVHDGVPLADVGARLRSAVPVEFAVPTATATGAAPAPTLTPRAHPLTATGAPGGHATAHATVGDPLDAAIDAALVALAGRYRRLSGTNVARIEARITDEYGATRVVRYPADDAP